MKRRRNGLDVEALSTIDFTEYVTEYVKEHASAPLRRALEKTDSQARDGMVRLGAWCREIERSAPKFKPFEIEEDDDG